MTMDADIIDPADAAHLNASRVNADRHPPHVDTVTPETAENIVSVNKKGSSDNKVGKAIFLLLIGAFLVGVLAFFSQNWLNNRKAQMKAHNGPKTAQDTTQVFNPEKTGVTPVKPRLGSDSGLPPPSQVAASSPTMPGAIREDGVRPLRGADGKVMVNAQGRAMGVDKDGNVIEVPAILAMAGDQAARKPLPGEGALGQGQQGSGGGLPPTKAGSRYGGSLFVDDPSKSANAGLGGAGSTAPSSPPSQTQQIADILRSVGVGGGGIGGGMPAARAATPGTMAAAMTGGGAGGGGGGTGGIGTPPEQARPGTVGSSLYSSATPVAFATRMSDQNLILPKGRQADCVLTGRIIDEVPGFTSCVLAQNLYSDNGRVLLLERGSELTGEYGTTNQLGLERLFVTWTRLRTPEGIEVDLSSPGSDALGTSGVPGHLDNRWGARIGAAFLLSFVKDITVALINKETQSNGSSSTVNVQTLPGQNTMNASSSLAEEVIKQTIKVRPRLTINEGDRISIYVARDLDFSPVYALKTAGVVGMTKLLAK